MEVDSVCDDLVALAAEGRRVILVHGGADDVDELGAQLGVAQRRLLTGNGVGSRYTDSATLEVVLLALLGRSKPRILRSLARTGATAVGLSGLDANLLRARRNPPFRATVDGRRVVVRDDHCGRLLGVNTLYLRSLLGAGIIPVISPPAVDQHGAPLNVDADRVAAAIAVAVGAGDLVLLTAVPGVLGSPPDETTVLSTLTVGGAEWPLPTASGGMRPKLAAAKEALLGGVSRVVIGDGRHPGDLRRALDGAGTRVALPEMSSPC